MTKKCDGTERIFHAGSRHYYGGIAIVSARGIRTSWEIVPHLGKMTNSYLWRKLKNCFERGMSPYEARDMRIWLANECKPPGLYMVVTTGRLDHI